MTKSLAKFYKKISRKSLKKSPRKSLKKSPRRSLKKILQLMQSDKPSDSKKILDKGFSHDIVYVKKLFDMFYIENKNKTCTFNTDYSLNEKKYERYKKIMSQMIRLTKNPEVRTFLEYYKNIEYISFWEFKNTLNRSAKEFIQFVQKEKATKQNVKVILHTETVNKSSFWVIMLCYPMIQKYIDGIITSTSNIHLEFEECNHLIVIFPDDCIYSGEQFSRKMFSYDDFKKVCNKVTMYSLCPYVCMDNLKNRTIITKYIDMGYINMGYYQQIDIVDIKPKDVASFQSNLFYRKVNKQLNIYFQHKLADNVSIAWYILIDGCTPDPNICLGSLINNCPYDKPFKKGVFDFQKESDRCPPSCYKQIQYTWNAKKIDPRTNILSIFRENFVNSYSPSSSPSSTPPSSPSSSLEKPPPSTWHR